MDKEIDKTPKEFFEAEYNFLLRQYQNDHTDPFTNFLLGGVLDNLSQPDLAVRNYRLFVRKAALSGNEKLWTPYLVQASRQIERLTNG